MEPNLLIIIDYEKGSFALPPLPQHDVYYLQSFVNSILSLISTTSCFQENEEKRKVGNEIILTETCEVIIPVEVVFAETEINDLK